jgi:hypothetical protein
MTAVQINTLQKVNIAAAFLDAAGVATPIVGVPVWASSDTAIATVSPAADGLSCDVISVAPGTVQITVTAEGDPKPGVDTITGEQDVIVVADEATQVVLTPGTPVNK